MISCNLKLELDLEKFRLFKYADDMALVALLKKGDTDGEEVYREHVSSLQDRKSVV